MITFSWDKISKKFGLAIGAKIFKSVERLNFTKLPNAKNGDFLEMF